MEIIPRLELTQLMGVECQSDVLPKRVIAYSGVKFYCPFLFSFHIQSQEGIAQMKLYFSPAACSLASHIVLHEAGYQFDTEQVNLADKKTANGNDFSQINPKGYVPALKLEDGQVLTEGVAIMQYLADQKPESGLIPKAGSIERYRLVEWLNYIATEVHKTLSPLWRPTTPEETKQALKDLFAKRVDYIAHELKDKSYLMGEQFTVADAYLFTVLNWCGMLKVDLSKWPSIQAYISRAASRPRVQQAMKAEGLIKA